MKKHGVPMAVLALLFASCGVRAGPEAVSAASGKRSSELRELLTRYMPKAMSGGMVKVALVHTLAMGDYARQFQEGSVAEGRALGFTVDTFNGWDDPAGLLRRIAGADYDGIILSPGGENFSRAALTPALERGIKVVTFDVLPEEMLPGLTSTVQDDEGLAEISLEALLACFERRPLRIIRAWFGPGIPPQDRRKVVFDRYVEAGTITELAVVSPPSFTFAREGVHDALASLLPQFPPGTVDAIWAPDDEFAKGCVSALAAAGRGDLKLVSIDISNDDIKLMVDHSDIWIGTASTDPLFTGAANMRILAAMFAGDPVPETYTFGGQFVETAVLSRDMNMANLARLVPVWKQEGELFDAYPWVKELKTAEELRLPPDRGGLR